MDQQQQNAVSAPASGDMAAAAAGGSQQPNRGGGRGGRGGHGGRGFKKYRTRDRCNICYKRGHHARECPTSAGIEALGHLFLANRGGRGRGGRGNRGDGGASSGNRQTLFAVGGSANAQPLSPPSPTEQPATEQETVAEASESQDRVQNTLNSINAMTPEELQALADAFSAQRNNEQELEQVEQDTHDSEKGK